MPYARVLQSASEGPFAAAIRMSLASSLSINGHFSVLQNDNKKIQQGDR